MSKTNDNNVNEPLLEDHEYDGIRELDNPLPRWWLVTFYGTIIFSVFYYGYYQLGPGPTLSEELNAEMTQIQAQQQEAQDAAAGASEEELAALLDKPEALAQGKTIYDQRCSACHGQKGEGLIGPNLTDAYWIHYQGTIVDIAKIINEGVTEKGMPPWGNIIAPEDVHKVAAYVKSLVGTNPANAKGPEGKEIVN